MPLRLLHAADWKSAIQQSGTLRYIPGLMQPCDRSIQSFIFSLKNVMMPSVMSGTSGVVR
jgi:hypothetical protein